MAELIPFKLSEPNARKMIAELSVDTEKIVIVPHGKTQAARRKITRRQIELCVQKGIITEGPFLNNFGNWQVTIQRTAAGEQITCVVAIDWPNQLIVITTYR